MSAHLRCTSSSSTGTVAQYDEPVQDQSPRCPPVSHEAKPAVNIATASVMSNVRTARHASWPARSCAEQSADDGPSGEGLTEREAGTARRCRFVE